MLFCNNLCCNLFIFDHTQLKVCADNNKFLPFKDFYSGLAQCAFTIQYFADLNLQVHPLPSICHYETGSSGELPKF